LALPSYDMEVMSVSNLYAGSILLVDLSTGKVSTEPTSSYAPAFLGGRGINIKLLYDNISPGTDPLDPGNVLVFGVGPLGGTSISTGRTEITARSPQTGLLGSSNFGGFFGSELKYAGYDHIVVLGKSEKPVYLWIENDRVEIKDASSLWGKDTYKTPTIIHEELGNPEAKILCIGPGGEKLVRYATIQHGMGHGAGRTGMGAVMGSKNLKAIAVRGTGAIKIADPMQFLAIAQELEKAIKGHPLCQELAQEGVSRYQDRFAKDLDPTLPGMHDIYDKFKPKRTGCFGCPVQCMDKYEGEGNLSGVISCELYPAYATLLRCHDVDVSLECAILSQRYGIDCITVSETIHWLMDLYKAGIITADDTDGIPMEMGDATAIRAILDKITFREGVGDILAEGVLAAAEEFGRNTKDYANQIKGMPMVEGHMPEWLPYYKGASLAGAVGARGDTMRSMSPVGFEQNVDSQRAMEIAGTEKAADPNEYEGKPELAAYAENVVTICDILSTCKYLCHWFNFHPFDQTFQARLFSAGSGKETTPEKLFEFAEKVRTMERAYEIGEGLHRDQDTLPKSYLDNPITAERLEEVMGESAAFLEGVVLESAKFEEMKSKYYELRGWDVATGAPTEEILKKYGLDDVAEGLKNRGKLSAAAQSPE